MKNKILIVFFAIASIVACSPESHDTQQEDQQKYARDPHSFANPNEIAITHLDLRLTVDFEQKALIGSVTYKLERNSGNTLRLDVNGLIVQSVIAGEVEASRPAEFKVKNGNALGDMLEITLDDTCRNVVIYYATTAGAEALLWLEANQTHDKVAPFLFTQGQAILTRTWIPIQDSPSVRITYNAEISVPKGMMALMSAESLFDTDTADNFHFKMEEPIAPYLMALAVGKLEFQSLGERTGVYAEPGLLEGAAAEFEDMESMLLAAEALYGPYAWGRYDVLVLPPSFPFGGMENPRLTFATPTIIAGDKSLTSLIAHELAHSWSGNLVTNATWNDFWLNEGFTVYFEKRIMEAIYGRDYAEMLNLLGYQDLQLTLNELGAESPDTHLKLDLAGRNPDDGMTDIAYEKGYLMLRWLEELAGRERFDTFLKAYFNHFKFQSLTTEQFVAYLDSELLTGMPPRPDVEAWIYAPGLPTGHPVPVSKRFDMVDVLRVKWEQGDIQLADMPAAAWSTHEYLHFLRGLSAEIGIEKLNELDATFGLSASGNSEIAAGWYLVAIENDYKPAFDAMGNFLESVGRRKFLKPLYEALAATEHNKTWAREVYVKARPNYHAVAVGTIDEILR